MINVGANPGPFGNGASITAPISATPCATPLRSFSLVNTPALTIRSTGLHFPPSVIPLTVLFINHFYVFPLYLQHEPSCFNYL